MFSKPKNWFSGGMWKPKNPHSVEHLKYLYSVLCKNQTIGEHNRSLLVETLRSISEILIWGDQNDSSVFDFFLEKSMLAFFLRYMRQKSGRYICVQLLQTLNILFENISNETSLYYLLSNNHINSIITHKFDFSDEEVMAYYISFLKTLSLKLNKHTIHFFYNEHTNDFALYTEAIKFFNHSESMVRIAVRTITLNVYKVDDKAMLGYIRDRTAAPYFTNLVWFIGIHILDLDACVRNDDDHQSRNRLSDLVAEHLDHLHYMNDIFYISLDALNAVLTEHLLNRLFIPLYVYSLTRRKKIIAHDEKKHISSVVSLYLLSQVFLIISHKPLVRQLAEIIFQGDIMRPTNPSGSPQLEFNQFNLVRQLSDGALPDKIELVEFLVASFEKLRLREFTAPRESLERTLENNRQQIVDDDRSGADQGESSQAVSTPSTDGASSPTSEVFTLDTEIPCQNSTDEEKLVSTLGIGHRVGSSSSQTQRHITFSLDNRPYLEEVFNALECVENDYETLFALCLLYAMGHNAGIHQGLLDAVLMPTDRSETKEYYSVVLVDRLIKIITSASQPNSKVRLATLELCIKLLKQLVYKEGKSFLQDRHLACIENAREAATLTLRNFYKSEEIFLDMFEDEYREMKDRPLNVEYLTMDASILLPPTGTPLTGIDFNKRLPCGEVERARKAIRAFFLIRDLSLMLLNEPETQLPLTREKDCISLNDILDLNNSDLIACTISTRDSRKQERRFLVIDAQQMILVEPDLRRLGWGVVRFVGYLQDVEVTGDKEDSRSLHITIHKPAGSIHATPSPHISARFLFDDHIRCMAAKQRLTKGRHKSRQQKMQRIERLLEMPLQTDHQGSNTPAGLYYGGRTSGPVPGRIHALKVPSGRARHYVTGGPPVKRAEQEQQHDRRVEVVSGVQQVSHDNKSPKRPVLDREDPNDGIEMAVEATSAVAFQTLNQQASISATNHRRDRSTSPIETNQVQEIPMEDLSQRSRKLSGPQDKRTSQIMVTPGPCRSHSLSPQRGRSSSSEKKTSSERNRSTSFTSQGTQTHLRSTTPVRRQHSKSLPMTKSSSPVRSQGSTSSEDSPPIRDHKKDLIGKPPKTLRPAQAPALTLLPSDNSVVMPTKDSLKLLPPTNISQVQSLSDISSSSSETDVSNFSRKASDFPVMQNFEDVGSDQISKGSKSVQSDAAVHKASGKSSSSTSAQLKKLAQIVQEHYSYEEDDDQP